MSEDKKKETVKLRGVIRHVYKTAGRAMHDYGMLADGDRILIALSGGKDSWALYQMMKLRKAHIPINFSYVVLTVDCSFSEHDKQRLRDYFARENVEFVFRELPVEHRNIDCFWCSWNKRKVFFLTAREYGCNKIALAHHIDDAIETTLMNLCIHGTVSGMRPNGEFFEGELKVIRPFIYLPESDLTRFTNEFDVPIVHSNCPYASVSRRRMNMEFISTQPSGICGYTATQMDCCRKGPG